MKNKQEFEPYSVLMSVYDGEKPEYLRQAMDSIWQQTVPCDDFVLVCDGPVNEGLQQVIEEMQQQYHERLQVVPLAENVGLGKALNAGISRCRHDLIARMDSDDISRPDRCERQLQVFANDPQLALCSGTVEEFSRSTAEVEARRIVPEKDEEIRKFIKSRNPFNHPCIMYRRRAVEDAGGYQDFFRMEDYYLWVRMIRNGCHGHNIQQPLLWMRSGSDMYRRRSGWKYAASQIRFYRYMKDIGMITPVECAWSVLTRTAVSLIPNGLRTLLYRRMMRQ